MAHEPALGSGLLPKCRWPPLQSGYAVPAPISAEDLYRFRWIDHVRLSRDGERVAYQLRSADTVLRQNRSRGFAPPSFARMVAWRPPLRVDEQGRYGLQAFRARPGGRRRTPPAQLDP